MADLNLFAAFVTGSVMYAYAGLVLLAAAMGFAESSLCGMRSPSAGADSLALG